MRISVSVVNKRKNSGNFKFNFRDFPSWKKRNDHSFSSKQTEMGVKNLWDILESCKKTLPLHHLQNKRVCIDLSCWIVQLQNVNKSYRPQTDKLFLRGLFHRLRALIALNCSVIFVSDGSIPAIKLSTYRRRLNSGSEVTQDDKNLDKMSSLRRNMGSEFSCMIKEAKSLGLSLGVPCLEGVEEAEAQCALLNLESLCDGCFSSDSDIFLFGARTVYRDIWLGERGYVVCYEMDDIERKLGFGRNSLITLALLLGSDYSQGVRGLGPESACQIVKSVGDNVVLQRIASEGLSFVKRAKNSKKEGRSFKCNNKEESLNQEINVNGTDHSLQRETPFSQVIDAYSNPKCYSADSEAVHRVLAQHPFQCARLRQVCAQFFQWPPEKTDEYILPKIAERDLRRFANLRANTLALGVDLPLQKVPVKCPITGIIKSRKLQGKECFEVSWEESYGLKSSVVPADLIESACPEKIVEFEERRALRQPKKSKPKSSAAEIDQKLQALMLDIESENSTSSNASFSSRAVMSEDWTAATEIDLTRRQELLLDAESKSNANMSCYPIGSTAAKAEIIDLVSPSPVQCRNVSRIREMSDQPINTIELSDSETEKSPELERKARELRMFIASIRDDIS